MTRAYCVQRVKRRLANGETQIYNYLRTPLHLQHIIGHRIRLDRNPELAARQARLILTTEIDKIDGADDQINLFAKKAHDNALARANKRGLRYELSKEKIIAMLKDQDYLCAVSGMPFSLEWESGRNPFGPSLDRIENSEGYTEENTRLVLSAVNYGLNVWGLEIYSVICAAVAQKQNVTPTKNVKQFQNSVKRSIGKGDKFR